MNRNTDMETETAMTLSLCMQSPTPIYTGSFSRQCNQNFAHAAGFPPRNGLKSLIRIILRTGKQNRHTAKILVPQQYYSCLVSLLKLSQTILLLSCQSTGGILHNTMRTLSVQWRYTKQYYYCPVSPLEVSQHYSSPISLLEVSQTVYWNQDL